MSNHGFFVCEAAFVNWGISPQNCDLDLEYTKRTGRVSTRIAT